MYTHIHIYIYIYREREIEREGERDTGCRFAAGSLAGYPSNPRQKQTVAEVASSTSLR